jgi:eukaryotic-like serine/threonine-protein kinase
VIENSVAYLTSQDGTVLALNANSGAVLWRYSLGGLAYNSPLVVNGVLYVDSNQGAKPDTFYALRALDGAVLWRHEISGFVPTPIISNGVIYLSNGSTLLALNASDGQQLWGQKFDASFVQFVQLVDGVLYFTTTKMLIPSTTGNVSPPAQAMTFGNLLWNDLQTVPTRPLKEGRSSVYAVRASDGAVLWHFDLNKGENSWVSWLSTEHGVIYVGSNDVASTSGSHVYALRGSDGSLLWEDEISASSSSAIVANGVIYLGTALDQAAGAVYALRASDGSSLWSYPLNGAAFNGPILVDTTLYVSTSNETIFALRAENGSLAWHRFIGSSA